MCGVDSLVFNVFNAMRGLFMQIAYLFQAVLSLALGGLDIRMVPSKAVIVFFPFWLLTCS